MNIKVIAAILLIERLFAVAFILPVLFRQYRLMGVKNNPELGWLRLALFSLSFIVFLGQFVPILIDTATLLADVRRTTPAALGIAYAFSNATTAVLSSIVIWLIYKRVGNTR